MAIPATAFFTASMLQNTMIAYRAMAPLRLAPPLATGFSFGLLSGWLGIVGVEQELPEIVTRTGLDSTQQTSTWSGTTLSTHESGIDLRAARSAPTPTLGLESLALAGPFGPVTAAIARQGWRQSDGPPIDVHFGQGKIWVDGKPPLHVFGTDAVVQLPSGEEVGVHRETSNSQNFSGAVLTGPGEKVQGRIANATSVYRLDAEGNLGFVGFR
ncbi:MAG: hypothetical protein FJX76_24465 [Armatimonadetes bacterium]|nr:hypothetical protein [Armatimonadota bacterium]